ncbi:MAG: glycoside hydrolase family 125 protein [Marinilabiliales bacterium]|nr:glycoside hydrolase family 125 protein [Marinilabiliales bacterium]
MRPTDITIIISWTTPMSRACCSMPYLGTIDRSDPLYLRTRSFVLSRSNPYYFSGIMRSRSREPAYGHQPHLAYSHHGEGSYGK